MVHVIPGFDTYVPRDLFRKPYESTDPLYAPTTRISSIGAIQVEAGLCSHLERFQGQVEEPRWLLGTGAPCISIWREVGLG